MLASRRLAPFARRAYHYRKGAFGVSVNSQVGHEDRLEFPEVQRTVADLVDAYQRHGYRAAQLDPLRLWDNTQSKNALRSLLNSVSSESEVSYGSFNGTPSELVDFLEQTYCDKISLEFKHLHDIREQEWLAAEFEAIKGRELTDDEKKEVAELMLKALAYEKFLETKIPTLKRYSGEGAEAAVPFHAVLIRDAPQHGVKELIWGGAHRGRLALHTILFGLEPEVVLAKIRGKPEFPEHVQGSGDVLSHLNCHHDVQGPHGTIHLSTVPNPSHLEVAGPVAVGKARARSRTLSTGDYAAGRVGDGVLCLHYHGDGAFVGQGIVWETLSMYKVPHYRIGGSIHLVANNQVAFTAERDIGRSSMHCTDYAKALDCPAIHVNANSPEDVVRAAELALRYRQEFRKDIFVNLVCFRRHGHNEIDNPRFTNPHLYAAVDAQPSIADTYAAQLVENGVVANDFAANVKESYIDWLTDALKNVDEGRTTPKADHLQRFWTGYQQAPAAVTVYDTGIDTDLLKFVGGKSVDVPEGFEVHPHLLKTHVQARRQRLENGEPLDWATAEALAFGSLLLQGFDVRISGQDVGRATFSHRHGALVCQRTDDVHIPLNHVHTAQNAFFEPANSPLSEEAVLAFEYGFSIEHPKRLVIWEAQFGDFYNTAQVEIDTLIASGESKWLTQSGLVMMLPHGIDGMGPDHSSAHMERFLQLTDSRESQKPTDGDNVNMHVANPTTSAQYFHLLRRQCLTPFRKPLIMISPKMILRHPSAASPLSHFAPGTHFQPVLNDSAANPEKVKKVVFVSGKHAFLLMTERTTRNLDDVAVIRLERLCPFPAQEIKHVLSTFGNANKFVWSQEEPRNAGAWSFVNPRFQNAFGIKLTYAGRPELAWMATSIGQHHQKEAAQLLEDTFKA